MRPVPWPVVDTPPTALTCYRHTDRVTRLRCSECGRPICPDCSMDSAVGQKCPECARPQGRARVIDARRTVRAPAARTAPVAFGLIAVNAIVYLLGMLSNEIDVRLFIEGAQRRDLIEAGEWYRVATAMFLHGGLTHVLFNMWALYIFGPVLERRFGSIPFASLYVASGLSGGALFYLLGSPAWAVGASGAIFGLFGALLASFYRQRHSPAGRAVFTQLVVLLAINMALPLIVPNIAWEAHVGGLLAGMAIAAAWDRMPEHDGRRALRLRTLAALLVAAVALGIVILG